MTNEEIIDSVMPDNKHIAKHLCDIARVLAIRNNDEFIDCIANFVKEDENLKDVLWKLRDSILSGLSI